MAPPSVKAAHILEKLAKSSGGALVAFYQKSRAHQNKGMAVERSVSDAVFDLIPNTL